METFVHGLLSGIGHPVLGFDHLAFVILAGIAAALCKRNLIAPLGYLGGMLFGCLAAMFGFTLPLAEIFIGLSLLSMDYIVMSGRRMSLNWALVAFGVFGLFHGSAFAESIVGTEAAYGHNIVFGYLLGLSAVQYVVAVVAGRTIVRSKIEIDTIPIEPRLAGAAVAGVGLFLTLENIENATFALLGLG